MKALVIREPKSELQVEEREFPSPRDDEVLLRVRACGVCRGDLLVQQGEFPLARYPVVPGHEVAGVIELVGDRVQFLRQGARVGVSALFSSCGHCARCWSDGEFFCPEFEFTGVTKDGGYQEFMRVPAAYVAPLPDTLEFAEAAPLMCAGLTVYTGLRRAGFKPRHKVAVIGLGGLGHLAVLFARAMGGRVAVLSTCASKEAEAHQLGAERFIHTKGQAPGEALRAWEGGADIILATAPSVKTMSAAFPGRAIDGTLVVLGSVEGEVSVRPRDLIMGRRRLMGSPVGSRKDLHDALEFAAAHGIRPRVTRFPLGQGAEALAAMQQGRLPGRAVLVAD